MNKLKILLAISIFNLTASAQTKVEWVSSSQTLQWQKHKNLITTSTLDLIDAQIELYDTLQTIEGFGTCFNELGWTSLSLLPKKDREKIFKELFSPNQGANFTICRMPVGANDFSRNWYSYNETEGDFEMKKFSIANDFQTLIPFIKSAQKYYPNLKLWASPWSPPSWMKTNKHYAAKAFPKGEVPKDVKEKWGIDFTGLDNGLKPEQEGFEGTDMFVQEDKYFESYALYFAKFIQAYKAQNIHIGMVMPQNEFNSAQFFPSCTWTANGLSKFLHYLVPKMHEQNVDVFLGTMERPNTKLVDTILTDAKIGKDIKGVAFQWAGKDAIPTIHKNYPKLTLYQSEQECGNGKNDWEYAKYTWSLMKHYLSNGANAYLYWNTSLKDGGKSTWGWHQNSLVSVDSVSKTYKYNFEYYVLKHLSHFVKPGAKRIDSKGTFENLLAFINTDKSVVVVAQNDSKEPKTIKLKISRSTNDGGIIYFTPTLEPDSFNTFLLKR